MKIGYPFKVWLATILASPFTLILCWGTYNSASLGDFVQSSPLILMMILFGIFLSLPALVLFRLLFKELKKHKIKVGMMKLILAVTGIIFIWITFFMFDRDFFKDADFYSLSWPGSYSVVLFVCSFTFRIKNEPDLANQMSKASNDGETIRH